MSLREKHAAVSMRMNESCFIGGRKKAPQRGAVDGLEQTLKEGTVNRREQEVERLRQYIQVPGGALIHMQLNSC